MKTRLFHLVTFLVACMAGATRADYYAAHSGQTSAVPYTSWATAASNIQDAVNSAIEGATVWVGPGKYTLPPNATNYMYSANVVYINKLLTLRSSSGNPEDTIIDGQGANRGIAVNRSVTSSKLLALDGLTISNCLANTNGGGIVITPTFWTGVVQNCVITHNKALGTSSTVTMYGGGFYVYTPGATFGLTISNCVIRKNNATNTVTPVLTTAYASRGGGIYLYGGTGRKRIVDCLIEDNLAYSGGGAAILSPASIEHCTIRGNRCYNTLNINTGGGGLEFASGPGFSLRNCLIYKNRSPAAGGAIFKMESTGLNYITTMDSCTVVSNYAASGRMIHWRRLGGLTMRNSIVYGNDIAWRPGAPRACTNNWVYGQGITNGVHGTGNITNNIGPYFVNLGGDNFRLTTASRCLNAGTNQPWMETGFDLDDGRRIDGTFGVVDMGCYEFVYHGSLITIK